MKTPKTIKVTFTERDRQGAKSFISNDDCLLGYALHRRGYSTVDVRIEWAMINGLHYRMRYFGPREACDLPTDSKPFYGSEVVGTKITLTRA